MLLVIFAVAQIAKDAQNQIQDIARSMLASQGFIISPVGNASAYASQAKKTISYYMDGKRCKRPKLSCWGCSGNHSWIKRGKVVCPCGTDPQVIKVADQWYAEFKDTQAKRGNKPKGKGKRTLNYKDMDETLNKKMCKTILAMTVEESEKAAMAVTTACTGLGPVVFMLLALSIPVFNITPPPHHILPVPIQAAPCLTSPSSWALLLDVPVALQSAVLWTLLLPSQPAICTFSQHLPKCTLIQSLPSTAPWTSHQSL
jgi:hypothetical protein